MKYLLLCTLGLVLVAGGVARADFDSDTATIKKKSDKMATVMVDKKSMTVPVMFDDGADWSCVKDHYELSDASLSAVKSGHACMKVGSDGSVSFSKKMKM
jgi:glutaredoxin